MSTFSVADIPDMTGKTVIVTGASSGIGLAATRARQPQPARASCSRCAASKRAGRPRLPQLA